MSTSSKSLSDDFNDRITKKCLPIFRDRVIPTHILPYLTCLERIDEEIVAAQQNQVGETLAADILFRRLIRRPNWFKDLVHALRQPNVGLTDMAEKFEDLIVTVPVRWEIESFEDATGHACVDEHCSLKDSAHKIDPETLNVLECSGSSVHDTDISKNTSKCEGKSVDDTKQDASVHASTSFEPDNEFSLSDSFKMDLQYHDEVHESNHVETDKIASISYTTCSDISTEVCTQDKTTPKLFTEEGSDDCSGVDKDEDETKMNIDDTDICTDGKILQHECSDQQTCASNADKSVFKSTECEAIHPRHKETQTTLKRKPSDVISDRPEETVRKTRKLEYLKEQVSMKREELRLKFMEKIYGFIVKPEDVPLAIMYMEKINVHVTGIDKGSILFNVKAKTLEDLDHLQKMWRYGGLKRLLDKELLSNDKVKILQELAELEGYPVDNITSSVTIHDADIDRCKSWLAQTENEPVHILDGLAMSKEAPFNATQDILKISKYVRDRLPECLRRMVEDPFLLGKIDRFYQLDELRMKMDYDSISNKGMAVTSSVAILFLAWFENELTEYIRTLDGETMTDIVKVSCVMFMIMQGQNTNTIPIPFQKQDYANIASLFPLQSTSINPDKNEIHYNLGESLAQIILNRSLHKPSDLLSLIGTQDQILIDLDTLQDSCNRLHEAGILRPGSHGWTFSSELLRDVVIFNMLTASHLKQVMEWSKFPFILQLLAYFGGEEVKRTPIPNRTLRLMYNDYRTVQILMCRKHYISGAWSKSAFHVPDIFCMKSKGIGFDYHMEYEAKQMARTCSIMRTSRDVHVDLSNEKYGPIHDDELGEGNKIVFALQWLNLMSSIHSFSQLVSSPFYWKSLEHQAGVTHTTQLESTEETITRSVTAVFASRDENTTESADSDERRKRIRLDDSTSSTDDDLSQFSEHGNDSCSGDEGLANDVQIVSLNLSGQKLDQTNLKHLTNYIGVTPTVTTLCLKNCHLQESNISGRLKTESFQNISHLNISDNECLGQLLTEPLGIMNMTNLECLEMQKCNLGDNGVGQLSADITHLKKLTKLNVANNAITAEGLLELSSALMTHTGLTSLQLQKNYIEYHGSRILANWLKRLFLLEILDISECGIEDDGLGCIAKSLVSQSLRRLLVKNNKVSTKGAESFFVAYTRSPLLNELDFSGNTIFTNSTADGAMGQEMVDKPVTTTEAIQNIENFFKSPHPWNHIYMSKCGLGYSRIFRDVRHLQSLTEITYVGLQDNVINDNFTEDLAQCIRVHCSLIMHINLRHNRIGDEGARLLASSFKDKYHLEEVFLDDNVIEDRGAEDLANTCFGLTNFKTLDLSSNHISEITKGGLAQAIRTKNKDVERTERVGQHQANTFVLRKEILRCSLR